MRYTRSVRCRLHPNVKIALLLTTSLPMSLMATAPAQAQAEAVATPVEVSVPAGDLEAGLRSLSSQTGVQLIYNPPAVVGKTTSGVEGRLPVDQALARVLAGTGLVFRIVNGRTIQIDVPIEGAIGERVLGVVRVEGNQKDSYVAATRGEGIAQLGGIRGRQDEEADGYRAKVASVGTGTPVAIEDVPRSVTVATQEQLQKQDVRSIAQALQRLPGVTLTERANAGLNPPLATVRGYELKQYQIDGGAPRNLSETGASALSIDAFERVELVRGPNALFVGEGSAGGSLNLVRKRPGAVAAQSVALEGGSFDRIGAMADVSTPSVFGSPFAFRAVASVRREGANVDDYRNTSELLYGIFDAPLGDNARLEFGGQYTRVDQDGENNGALSYVTGTLLPLSRRFNYSAGQGTFLRNDSAEVFGKIYVNLGEHWDVEFGGFYRHLTTSSRTVTPSGFRIRPDGTFVSSGYFFINESGPASLTQLGLDAKLTGRFDTFGLTHNVFASLNHNRTDFPDSARSATVGYANIASLNDLRNPQFQDYENIQTADYSGGYTTTTGIVIGDSISWRDMVTLGATVRRDDVKLLNVQAQRDGGVVNGIFSSTPVLSGTWRPSYSAAVKPFERLTLYASYADGFLRQDDQFSRSGTAPNFVYTPLSPSQFRNKEVGVKYGAAHWLATLSLFDLKRVGVAAAVTGLRACPSVAGGALLDQPCYFAGGATSTSRGVDFDISGEVTKGLSIVGNVNYNKTKTVKTGVPLQTLAPQTSASLFVDWTPGFLPRAALQVGVRYKSRYYNTGDLPTFNNQGQQIGISPFTVSQKAYAVGDIGIEYQVDDTLTARLFVENVTDKKYLSTLQVLQGSFYGAPRTFLARLTWHRANPLRADGRSPTTGLAPFGDPADWYAAFDAGYAFTRDLDATASGKAQDGRSPVAWTFQTRDKPAFAVRLGRYFGDNLRGEAEFGYRTASFGRIGGSPVAPFGVCGAEGSSSGGAPFDCNRVPGRIDTWSLLANVVYDFGPREAVFRPFLGLGVGLSRNSVSFTGKLDGIGGTTPWQITEFGFTSEDTARKLQEAIISADTRMAFTAQALAGVSLRLSDRLHIAATYRYVATPSLRFSSYNLDELALYDTVSPLTSRVGTFKSDSRSQVVTLGVRWAFGTK